MVQHRNGVIVDKDWLGIGPRHTAGGQGFVGRFTPGNDEYFPLFDHCAGQPTTINLCVFSKIR